MSGSRITTAIGFAVGFRIHGSLSEALAAFGLCIVFGFAFEWLFIALGMFAGSAQAAQGLALMVFPLTFVSSAYVPIETMPGWMQAIAENQPITHMVDAVRALTQGPAAEAVLGHQASYSSRVRCSGRWPSWRSSHRWQWPAIAEADPR